MRSENDTKRIDEDYSQAIVRMVVTFLIFIYLSMLHIYKDEFTLSSIAIFGMYLLYSIYNYLDIVYHSGDRFRRRVRNIFGDIAVVSYAMYSATMNGVVLYPVLLWIVVGNGIRFGVKYLLIAMVVAEIFFTSALLWNPYWKSQHALIYSLSFGLVVLGLFYAKLIARMHHLNETLEKKVQERVAEVEYRYLHDALTNLKNREALKQDIGNSDFGGLFVVDIDQFHNYNELYGMAVGDEVLVQFSALLKSFASQRGYEVYRVYSDHFALRVLARNVTYPTIENDILALYHEVECFTVLLDEMQERLQVDITVGISLEKEKALKKAEMALSYAKKKKIPYIAYSQMIDTSLQSQELLSWKEEIKRAVNTDNIIPLFQPIVDRQQNVVKYEALMRLRREVNGHRELVSPFYFLDIAVKSKQYPRLTQIMIEKSFKIIAKSGLHISINLSFEDIVNTQITDMLRTQIEKYRIGNRVIFEIVESSDIEDFARVKAFIEQFRRFGVRIAIDDFGSGYSNFSHIIEISPDFLKVDGSLVKEIDKDEKSYMMVRSIVQLAKHMNIETIAEFVSSKEIFDICYRIGVDYFQGYYFSKPLDASEILADQTSLPSVV